MVRSEGMSLKNPENMPLLRGNGLLLLMPVNAAHPEDVFILLSSSIVNHNVTTLTL
jgi:hypothetical protein